MSVEQQFASLFSRLAKKMPKRIKDFRQVRAVLAAFASRKLGRDLTKLKFYGDLVNAGGVNDELVTFARGYYKTASTRSSEVSRLVNLITDELNEATSSGEITPAMASVGLIVAENLSAPLRQIWEMLPRIKGCGVHQARRMKLPLKDRALDLLRILLQVNDGRGADSAKALLQGSRDDVLWLIKTTLHHRFRRSVRQIYNQLSRRLDPEREVPKKHSEKNLPVKIRRAIGVLRKRGTFGFAPYPGLISQAGKYKGRDDGKLSASVTDEYCRVLVAVLSKLNLKKDTGLVDLLTLRKKPRKRGKRIVGYDYYNPIIEPYRRAQQEACRPHYKAKTYDSAAFRQFLRALFALARYNGEFDLPQQFQRRIKLRLDKGTPDQRKHNKKKRLGRGWIDAEIRRLSVEFQRIVKSKSFLGNRRDLELCLFLVQLGVMRYLGFRQQCLRRCAVGKNIIFNKDGSVTFYYEKSEIKNGVRINLTISKESCDEIPELVLLTGLLTTYYRRVLTVIRSTAPELYERQLGEMFFALPAGRRREGLIRKPPVCEGSSTSRDAAGRDGGAVFREFFEGAAYDLMNFDELVDFPHEFNPHLMRGHCCDWLRKDKKWSWEAISKVMGDTEETLKKDYYDEEEREQNADPFLEYNRKLKTERRQEERMANSVPLEAFNDMQAAFRDASEQLREERERTRRAEEEAKTYRQNYEFVLSVVNMSDAEVRALNKEELAHA